MPNLGLSGNESSKGYLFLFLIWMAFLLPQANWSTIPFITGYTNLSELAIIVMPFVYALYPRQKAMLSGTKYSYLRKAILVFFVLSILVISLQYIVYGTSVPDYIREYRLLIPLFVALSLIYLGPRISPQLLLMNLCLCLSASFLISLFCFFMDIKFTPFYMGKADEEAFDILREGRLGNVNMGYSYIAFGLLIGINLYRRYLRSACLVGVVLACCLLSIIISYFSFNRTFIIVSMLFLFYINFKFFSFRIIIATLSLMMLVSTTTYFAYNHSDAVQQQIRLRIIEVMQGQDAILESVYYNNRDTLYDDYWKAAKNYYFLGVPPNVPVSEKFVHGEYRASNVSDISVVTIFLHFGIIPLFVYIFIGFIFYKHIKNIKVPCADHWSHMIRYALLYSLPFMAIASLNIDILVRHYPILFVALLFLTLSSNCKSCCVSKKK